MKIKKIVSLLLTVTSLVLLVSCKSKSPAQTGDQPVVEAKDLSGAGATFPKVLYEKYFENYNQTKGIQVNYQAVGSGAGITNLIQKMVDFGATDAPMNAEEEKNAGSAVLHIPTALGAVVVTYNLPNISSIKMDAALISKIFLGTIKKWSDPAIKALNPEINFPDIDIVIIHRSDGSGTTYTFTDYLSKADKEWSDKIGKGKSVNWPIGLGGKGNDGVAGLMKQNIGSIAYVEYIYAINNNYSYASIKNKAGNFVTPTLESVSLAAEVELPDDLKVSITDTNAPNGYPIATFTWLLVYQEQDYSNRGQGKGLAVANMLWWVTHEAQSMNEPLHFGKLAPKVVQKAEVLVKSLTFDGKPILK